MFLRVSSDIIFQTAVRMMNMWVSHSLGLISSLIIPLFSTASREDYCVCNSGDGVFKEESFSVLFVQGEGCSPTLSCIEKLKLVTATPRVQLWTVDCLFYSFFPVCLSFFYPFAGPFHHLFQSSTLIVLLPCSTLLIFQVLMFHVFFCLSVLVIMFPSLTESSLPFIVYTFCIAFSLSLSPWRNSRRPPSVVQ